MPDKHGLDRANPATSEEHSMAQIRELLFGEQSRATDRHFARIEARLEEQQKALHEALDRQIARIGDEVENLRTAMQQQGAGQDDALQQLNASLSAVLQRLDERVTLLDSDQQDHVHRQQQAAEQQANELARVEQASADRAQLAELLEGMASQLRRKP